MDIETTASILCELGNPTRLSILRLLVRAGDDGMAVGDLQSRLDLPGSTLSHHLSRLVQVGVVTQEREGRVLRCRPCFPIIKAALAFVMEECCRDAPPPCCSRSTD